MAIDVFNFEMGGTLSEVRVVRWHIPERLHYFEGHFPENPVLPAIAVIDATVDAIRKSFSTKGSLVKIPTAKFLGVLKPGNDIAIHLSKISERTWKAEWNLRLPGGTLEKKAELTAVLGE